MCVYVGVCVRVCVCVCVCVCICVGECICQMGVCVSMFYDDTHAIYRGK